LVADTALELADQPLGLRDAAPLGGITEEQLAVIADEHRAADTVAAPPQRDRRRADAAVRFQACGRCRSPARSDVDGKHIRAERHVPNPPRFWTLPPEAFVAPPADESECAAQTRGCDNQESGQADGDTSIGTRIA